MEELEIKVVNVGLSKEFEDQMRDYLHSRSLGTVVVVGTVREICFLHSELIEGPNIVNASKRKEMSDVNLYINPGQKVIASNIYAVDTEFNPEPLCRMVGIKYQNT